MGRNKISDKTRCLGKCLGKVIADTRKNIPMTQSALSIEAAMDIDALRGLEQGRYANTSFFTVMTIARVLKISGEQLHAQAENILKEKKNDKM